MRKAHNSGPLPITAIGYDLRVHALDQADQNPARGRRSTRTLDRAVAGPVLQRYRTPTRNGVAAGMSEHCGLAPTAYHVVRRILLRSELKQSEPALDFGEEDRGNRARWQVRTGQRGQQRNRQGHRARSRTRRRKCCPSRSYRTRGSSCSLGDRRRDRRSLSSRRLSVLASIFTLRLLH